MSNLPPLSQSKVETASCPRSYVAIHIDGRSTGASLASDRGNELHSVMAEYVDHCTGKSVASDWVRFNEIAKSAGAESGGILDRLRDTYEVQWNLVYGVEITMMLDEEFRPTVNISDEHWPKHVAKRCFLDVPNRSEGYAAHIGTADVILLSEDGARAKIQDHKTHPSPFDADTYQSILYSFMLMKHVPELEQVTFELIFARYQNCTRSVTWKRKDMAEMQQTIARARERQKATHANPEAAKAIPCKQCSYCPLGILTFECPIREYNPMVSMNLNDRLMFKEWTRRMNAENTPILKAHAEVTGPISFMDGNGRVYEYGHIEVPSTSFPLDRTTVHVLEEYKSASGEDLLDGRLDISSTKLKGLLRAKKRLPLKEVFDESIIQTTTKPQWAVRTPEGVESDYSPYVEE